MMIGKALWIGNWLFYGMGFMLLALIILIGAFLFKFFRNLFK